MVQVHPNAQLMAGVPGSFDSEARLVRRWPVGEGFCDVVRHFLNSCVGRLQSERRAEYQFAYLEGYLEALKAASTDELDGAGAWRWHDDMVRCVDDSVAVYRAKIMP